MATSKDRRRANKQPEPQRRGEEAPGPGDPPRGGDHTQAASDPSRASDQTQAPSDPPRGGDHTQAPSDPLRQLGERLDRASLQARRLAAEAAEAALRGAPTPPTSGWAAPEADEKSLPGFEGLVAPLQSLRDLVPPELQRRLAEAVRELLLAIRALLDWYIERLDSQHATGSEAEDIPIL